MLLRSIDAELQAMSLTDDVSDYLECVPDWYEAVFAFHNGWQQGKNVETPALQRDAMRMLKVLGLYLSKVGLASVGSPTQRATLLACIESAVSLLEVELDGWDRTEKQYLYSILEAARRALEETSLYGEVDLKKLINELIGALTGIALDLRASEGKDSPRFERVMSWVGNTAGALRGILHDSEAITSLTVSVGTIAKAISQ